MYSVHGRIANDDIKTRSLSFIFLKMFEAPPVSLDVDMESSTMSFSTNESLLEDSNGNLQIEVDQTLAPYKEYDQWLVCREELASYGLLPQTVRKLPEKNMDHLGLSIFPKVTEEFVESHVLKEYGMFYLNYIYVS